MTDKSESEDRNREKMLAKLCFPYARKMLKDMVRPQLWRAKEEGHIADYKETDKGFEVVIPGLLGFKIVASIEQEESE